MNELIREDTMVDYILILVSSVPIQTTVTTTKPHVAHLPLYHDIIITHVTYGKQGGKSKIRLVIISDELFEVRINYLY